MRRALEWLTPALSSFLLSSVPFPYPGMLADAVGAGWDCDPLSRHAMLLSGESAMNLLDRVVIDPKICHGKPTLRGLRYPVETILELLSSGMTSEEILADFEDLERDDILAALAYAVRLTQVKRIESVLA